MGNSRETTAGGDAAIFSLHCLKFLKVYALETATVEASFGTRLNRYGKIIGETELTKVLEVVKLFCVSKDRVIDSSVITCFEARYVDLFYNLLG